MTDFRNITAKTFATISCYLVPVAVLLTIESRYFMMEKWMPAHDSLAQYSEFIYAYAAWANGELPLWNSYLYGGQEFYLLLNHGLLLNPIAWLWIGAGSALHLSPSVAFAFSHMTDIIFFSAGCALLSRETFKSRHAAVISFMLALFCGQSEYWSQQIYGLSVVIFLPWILHALLRYVRRQTAGTAVVLAGLLGISCNVYYPVYQATFMVMAVPWAFLFFKDSIRTVSWRKAGAHAMSVSPLVAALILPTVIIYLQVTAENSTFSRAESATRYWMDSGQFLDSLFLAVKETIVIRHGFSESVPLIGIAGVMLVFTGAVRGGRVFCFWLVMLVIMTLFYLQTYPVFLLGSYTIPFYRIMRTPGFYSGFVTLCLIMIASNGVSSFLSRSHAEKMRAQSLKSLMRDPIAIIVLTAGLALCIVLPPVYRPFTGITTSVLLCVRVAAYSADAGFRRSAFPLLWAIVLAGGVYMKSDQNRYRFDVVSWPKPFPSATFGFKFERPDRYQVYDISRPDTTPVIFYNIAEREDGPYNPGDGIGELFINRNYVKAAGIPGFGQLMKAKFHFSTHYAVKKTVNDYRPFNRYHGIVYGHAENTAKQRVQIFSDSVLVLDDDSRVLDKRRRLDVPDGISPPTGGIQRLILSLVSRTANKLILDVQTYDHGFLLYTDTYRDEFVASVDGRSVPLLKAMGVLKAIELTPGFHRVEFEYRHYYGYILTGYLLLCGMFALIAACALVRQLRSEASVSDDYDQPVC